MSGFKLSSELLIGGSSDLDAVFLPVNVDNNCSAMTCDLGPPSWEGTNAQDHQHHHHHHNHHNLHQDNNSSSNTTTTASNHHNHVTSNHSPVAHHHISNGRDQKIEETKVFLEDTEDEGDGGRETGSSLLVNAIITNQPDSTDWCYRTSLTSMGVIVIVIFFIVFGFDYVKQLLVWLEGVEPWQGVVVLMALFCVISFPMAWGLSLLMIVCG